MNETVYRGFKIKYLHNPLDNDSLFYICIGMDNITGDYLCKEYGIILQNNHLVEFNIKNDVLDADLYWVVFAIHIIDRFKAENYAHEMCNTIIELVN